MYTDKQSNPSVQLLMEHGVARALVSWSIVYNVTDCHIQFCRNLNPTHTKTLPRMHRGMGQEKDL